MTTLPLSANFRLGLIVTINPCKAPGASLIGSPDPPSLGGLRIASGTATSESSTTKFSFSQSESGSPSITAKACLSEKRSLAISSVPVALPVAPCVMAIAATRAKETTVRQDHPLEKGIQSAPIYRRMPTRGEDFSKSEMLERGCITVVAHSKRIGLPCDLWEPPEPFEPIVG